MTIAAAADIFRQLDREVWIVTADDGAGRRGGLLCTTVVSASIAPDCPRALLTLSHLHQTWSLVRASGRLALHLVSADQVDRALRFGTTSSRETDKFAGLSVVKGPSGAPRLTDAPAWIDCRVEATLSIGDRTVVLAEATDAEQRSNQPPLTVRGLLDAATAEQRALLRSQLSADAQVDAAAIAEWRARSPGDRAAD